jgi:hypothetical protein
VNKEVLAVVPAANDVVNRTRVFDPLFAWHEEEACRGAGNGSNLYILRLTPFCPSFCPSLLSFPFVLSSRRLPTDFAEVPFFARSLDFPDNISGYL